MTIDGRRSEVLKLIELVDRHQFDTVDSQLLQIRYLLNDACKCSLVLHTRTSATCEVTHMHLIDDKIVDGCLQGQIVLPVEVVEHHTGPVLIDIVQIGLFPPHIATHDQFRIRVEQNLGFVETVPLCRIERTVHPVAVFDVLVIEVENHHREHITQSELLEKGNFDERFFLAVVKEYQCAVGGITGIHREIDGVAEYCSPKRIRSAWAQFQSLILMRGEDIDSMHNRRSY